MSGEEEPGCGLRVLRLVYEQTATGWSVSSPDVDRVSGSAPTLDELKRSVDGRLAEWLGPHARVEETVRAALADAHEACAGPRISRNVAELLGIPLDDPDVEPEADCRHGCNGDCLESGSETCNFTCHT